MKRILKILASVVMFASGIMMIVYQFNGKKEYIFAASVGVAVFGLMLTFTNLFVKKDKK